MPFGFDPARFSPELYYLHAYSYLESVVIRLPLRKTTDGHVVMYWSFADMNVGEQIPIDATVKFVVAPDMYISLIFAHYGLEHPE